MSSTLLFYDSLNFHTCSKDVNQENNNKSSCGLCMHVKSEVLTSIFVGKINKSEVWSEDMSILKKCGGEEVNV